MDEWMRNNKHRFMKGTLILSVAAIFTKILSAVYRVPFQNIVGDVGFYIYQQIYPFYGIAIALSTYGFPVVVSKVLAEQTDQRDSHMKTFLYTAFTSIGYLSCILFFFLFFGADFIANQMGDRHLVPLIQTVSFIYLLVPFLSVMRGFHQGMGNMVPTALSQVVEQTIRVAFILLVSALLARKGQALYDVGIGAFFSAFFASFVAGILLFVMTIHRFPSYRPTKKISFKTVIRPSYRMITQGLAISISGLSLILFQMSDAFQLYSLLTKNGLNEIDAKMIKGVYDRSQPILQIGVVLVTSFSLSAVPFIRSALHRKDGEAKEYARFALQMGASFSAAATIGLIAIMEPLNTMLFENAAGTRALQILSPSVFFASVFLTATSVLQGYGSVYFSASVVLIGVLIKFSINPFFISTFGIHGAALATTLSFLFVSVITMVKLKKKIDVKNVFNRRFLMATLWSLTMLGISIGILFSIFHYVEPYFSSKRLFASIQAVVTAIVGGLVFLAAFLRTGIFTKEEMELLPFGEKLAKWIKKERPIGQ
ncbi:putative polysaccharide biosynthesis protein [Fervidibacillus albus]|uniref:Polysaccharide biosynthesis protein n=1 Tax=Fervidibacillus albus TaxID=2980026 RepID=A0A9E8RUE7_9BACI|nr:polysaccharide biosynthesis protein [Fervidibacillus albus]WAA09480.1 polysaccharide biosynthesis protein [Fervidibacillus albus]